LRADSLLYRSGRLPLLDATTTLGMFGVDRRARAEAVRRLAIERGERVLDIACGTGRALPLLAEAVGDDGAVIGIDRSAPLLRQARIRTRGLANVELRAGAFPDVVPGPPADAALCVLGLSVMADWQQALEHMLLAIRPGGRIAIVDWLVDGDYSRLLNRYIRAGSRLADADPTRAVVAACRVRLDDVTATRLPLGLQLVHGRVRRARDSDATSDCALGQSSATDPTAASASRSVTA
jgi:ubiquinone/menaquinone biosynthesis C-methylase UbiE